MVHELTDDQFLILEDDKLYLAEKVSEHLLDMDNPYLMVIVKRGHEWIEEKFYLEVV
jgi:hypothetical protein